MNYEKGVLTPYHLQASKTKDRRGKIQDDIMTRLLLYGLD